MPKSKNDLGVLHHYANIASRIHDFDMVMKLAAHPMLQGKPDVGDDWGSTPDLVKLSAKNWLEDGGASQLEGQEIDMGPWLITTDHLRGVIQRPYERDFELRFYCCNSEDILDRTWDGKSLSDRFEEKCCARSIQAGKGVVPVSHDKNGNPSGKMQPAGEWFVGGKKFVIRGAYGGCMDSGYMKGFWMHMSQPDIKVISRAFARELKRIEEIG